MQHLTFVVRRIACRRIKTKAMKNAQRQLRREPQGEHSTTASHAKSSVDLSHGIGRMLRAMRRARGMTQRQVAEAAGLSTSGISEIESGVNNLSIDMLWQLCTAMDVRPHLTLRGKDSIRPLLTIELVSDVSVPIQ